MAAIAILLGTTSGGKSVAVGAPGLPDPVKAVFRAAYAANGLIDGVQYSELQVLTSNGGRIKRKSFTVAPDQPKPKATK